MRLVQPLGPWEVPEVKERKRDTHCRHGHEFTQENTYLEPKTGNRQCKTCRRRYTCKRAA